MVGLDWATDLIVTGFLPRTRLAGLNNTAQCALCFVPENLLVLGAAAIKRLGTILQQRVTV